MNIESDHGIVVALNTHITPELKQEGIARELVRAIQDLRKEADYNVDDRIQVAIITGGETGEARNAFSEIICSETLAITLSSKKLPTPDQTKLIDLEGEKITIQVAKA